VPGDRRAAALAAVTALALLPAAPIARADRADDLEAPASSASSRAAVPSAPSAADGDPSPRAVLGRQLAAQTASVDRALSAVRDKLTAAERSRAHRLAAALRAARSAPGDDSTALARRRAAARLLLDRDRGERALLGDEISRLRDARDRVAGEVARLPAIQLPGELARPAPGKIARHFGTLEHERSHAQLSRRGIDLEVDERSAVVAPAAGTVRYAGPIRGLDRGVILDCGEFYAVIAKLGDASLPVGAAVAAGDRIGRALRHRVYLEIRVKLGPGGLPIDPEPLLAAAAATSRR
jgi:septal ring factor EnvC (AmiA/AmiB activator)